MGNVIVKEAYLDLLKDGLKMEHLQQFARNNEEKLDNETRHRMITEELTNLYLKKNHDYGNSFDISLDEDGLLVAKIRLGDKYQRFGSLLKKNAEVEDESKRDTLIDLANYAIMTVMWMDDQERVKEPVKGYDDAMDAIRHVLDISQDYRESKQRGKEKAVHVFVDNESVVQVEPYEIDDVNIWKVNDQNVTLDNKHLKPTDWEKPRLDEDNIMYDRTRNLEVPVKPGFMYSPAGADFDGDTLRVFTDDELARLAQCRELTTNDYVKCNIDDILAKKAGLK